MPKFVVKQIEKTDEPTVELWLEKFEDSVYLRARRLGEKMEWSLLWVDADGLFLRSQGVPADLGFKLAGDRLVIK